MLTRRTLQSLLLPALILLSACGSIVRTALPAEDYALATFLDQDDLRAWGDERPPAERRIVDESDLAELEERYGGIMHKEHHYLAISGGGANGAYGAGILTGWSDLETRPEFTMVTGISTGALTAPFAFLGPDYDDELREVYTTLDTTRIFNVRNLFSIFGGDSIVDTSPLSRTIEEYINDDVIAAIASEHRRGRTLHIGTTNLDAGRPMIWNIGRIANTGHPDAPDMIRKILRASASIPGAFPPVYIPVRGVDGKMYDEMHVDGGTSSQIFLYPAQIDWQSIMELLDVKGEPTAYLIRNSKRSIPYEAVNPKLIPIVGRTIDSLIKNQGIGDVYRIYSIAQRDGIDVKLTIIPEDAVAFEGSEAFDPEYMKALFNFGYKSAFEGEPWLDLEDLMENAD